jgi:hypothetical protein
MNEIVSLVAPGGRSISLADCSPLEIDNINFTLNGPNRCTLTIDGNGYFVISHSEIELFSERLDFPNVTNDIKRHFLSLRQTFLWSPQLK